MAYRSQAFQLRDLWRAELSLWLVNTGELAYGSGFEMNKQQTSRHVFSILIVLFEFFPGSWLRIKK